MNENGRVFVSSTSTDLVGYRAKVLDSILSIGKFRLFVKVRAGLCSGPGGECWRGTQRNEALEAA
jgi:hypothetical protein